ncbi:hypothetical protein ABZW11_45915 [Nonomuraea sp. NPDC004580]|uniref:hypothetical protein n=1 Tax=Nonomuraea sp. NPDC004580 TaxID=3154552 RepID=UPI00339F9EB9
MSVPVEHVNTAAFPVVAAERLQVALKDHDVTAEVHDGYGLALVSVWVGLVVWCDGAWFWWRVGWNEQRRQVMYARHPADEPARAARRVAFRYAELYRNHPRPGPIADLASSTRS